MTSRTAWTLAGVVAAAAALRLLLADGVVGGVAGLVLLVALGPAAGRALFPNALPPAERWVIDATCGLFGVVVGGVVLARFDAVGRSEWVAVLAVVTLVCLVVARLQERRTDRSATAGGTPRGPRPVGWRAMAAVAAVLVLGGSALGLSIASARSVDTPGSTQLWALPSEDPAHAGDVTIGVANRESGRMSYYVVLRTDRAVVRTWDISLAQGEEWTARTRPSSQTVVTVQLFTDGEESARPYREVELQPTDQAAPSTDQGR